MKELPLSYVKRIENSVRCIENSLTQESPPSLEQLAASAHLSKFHFHRIYRLVTGETCQQTVNRLKLAKAVARLENLAQSVTEAAMESGFGSSQALAKALKRTVQVSASDLRKEPQRLADTIEYLRKPDPDNHEPAALCIEMVSLEPMSIVVIHTEGLYPELNHTYEQLFMASGGPQNVQAILGIPGFQGPWLASSENSFECALLLNQKIDALPAPLQRINVSGGHFIRVRHTGSYSDLDTTLDALYELLLTEEYAECADKPCLFHYLDDPEEVEEAWLRTDLYLPVDFA